MNVTTQRMPKVEIIPASIFGNAVSKRKKLRVAAYCRVSTDEDDQLQSYENQVRHYTAEIEKNPEWVNVGIFADEGITGVMTKKRDEFNKMIDLCRAGKIDRILTKSTSRFARNTLDSLKYIRELKGLGISIYFEKENIDTLKMDSETIITVYSAFAQAESESISGNIKIGKRHKYKAGDVPMMYGNILGYKKGADGKPEIVPEEATTIRFIYDAYLDGNGYLQIARMLEEKGYKTKRGNTDWRTSAITEIEEYCKKRYEEVSAMQAKLSEATSHQQLGKNNKSYLTEIYEHVSNIPGKLTEYDDVFTRNTVTKVRILSNDQIEVTLYGAIPFKVNI